jgi:hypothetical protein
MNRKGAKNAKFSLFFSFSARAWRLGGKKHQAFPQQSPSGGLSINSELLIYFGSIVIGNGGGIILPGLNCVGRGSVSYRRIRLPTGRQGGCRQQ